MCYTHFVFNECFSANGFSPHRAADDFDYVTTFYSPFSPNSPQSQIQKKTVKDLV